MKTKIQLLCSLLLITGLMWSQAVQTENWANGKPKSAGAYKSAVAIPSNASKEDLQKVFAQLIKVGKWEYWYENGQLRAEEHYTDGVKTGIQKSWYDTGKPEYVIDLLAQKATYWYANGQKQSEGAVTGSGAATGNWISWHDNGIKNAEGSYNLQGQKEGVWKFWDEKGQLSGQQNYANGILH
jgi:antitoxin component YwqK of YwqJK toxin-antitoxin module